MTNPPDLAAFAQLRNAWQTVRPGLYPTALMDGERLTAMRQVQLRIATCGGWTQGPSTLMDVLGVTRNEVMNCRVVRWLLDPLGRHRIGTHLLTSLARELHLDVPDIQQARVEAEVSRDRSRADIVVTGPGGAWTWVLEAKVDAAEGDEQGRRLEEDWPEADQLVFLTIRGERLPWTAIEPARWRPLSWAWVADTTLRLLSDVDAPTDVRASEARHAAAAWAHTAGRNLA